MIIMKYLQCGIIMIKLLSKKPGIQRGNYTINYLCKFN